jgi:hypothetical protein
MLGTVHVYMCVNSLIFRFKKQKKDPTDKIDNNRMGEREREGVMLGTQVLQQQHYVSLTSISKFHETDMMI